MTAEKLATVVFEEHRSLLFGVAYRMFGTVAEAEDAVQESYLRYLQADGEIANPRAYLVTIVTRICLDVLKSARKQREQYVGVWLPEPIIEHSATSPSPEDTLETADSVSYAFLVMLEELGPVERAVFLLREVFDYDYADIAQVVMKSEAACRQVFHRARQHLNERHHRHRASYDQRQDLTIRFLAAASEGNMAGLLELLSADAVAYSDGGGKVAAALNPVYGADHVARFTLGVTKKEPLIPELADINGAPGLVLRTPLGEVHSVVLLEIEDGKVTAIYAIRNPDKLLRAG